MLFSAIAGVSYALLYLKARQAGGESISEILGQESEEKPQALINAK
jgi:hypothetical protein